MYDTLWRIIRRSVSRFEFVRREMLPLFLSPARRTCIVADGGWDGAQGAGKGGHGQAALAGGACPHVIHHPRHLQSDRSLTAVSQAWRQTKGGSDVRPQRGSWAADMR